jgi:2-oxoglutarate ferredoxin oxidoreductase subunit delta
MWCKGCRLCVEFCPTGVLDFVDDPNRPSVIHPEKCTACHWCDTHCPDLAIVVQRIA